MNQALFKKMCTQLLIIQLNHRNRTFFLGQQVEIRTKNKVIKNNNSPKHSPNFLKIN